jgi:NO-binding membrane sensor protein with MHYT domain
MSVALAFAGSLLTVTFTNARRRALARKDLGTARLMLYACGLSLGGVGIFSMHFVAMHALKLEVDGQRVYVVQRQM